MVRLYEARMDPVHIVATLSRLQELIRYQNKGSSGRNGEEQQHPGGSGKGAAGGDLEQRQREILAVGSQAVALLAPAIQVR